MARSSALWCLAVVLVAAGGASAAFAPLTVDQLPYETTAFEPSIDNMTMVSRNSQAWLSALPGRAGRCPASPVLWRNQSHEGFKCLVEHFPS